MARATTDWPDATGRGLADRLSYRLHPRGHGCWPDRRGGSPCQDGRPGGRTAARPYACRRASIGASTISAAARTPPRTGRTCAPGSNCQADPARTRQRPAARRSRNAAADMDVTHRRRVWIDRTSCLGPRRSLFSSLPPVWLILVHLPGRASPMGGGAGDASAASGRSGAQAGSASPLLGGEI